MKYVSAYMMAVLSGNNTPSKKDVTKILASVGVEVDDETVDALIKSMEGKVPHEVIAEGMKKLQAMPSGGGGGGAPAAAAPAAGGGGGGGGAAAAPAEAKKEEEEEEEEDLGFSLFD